MLLKISSQLYRLGWCLALGFVLLVGLYLGLGRYAISQLPQQEQRIAAELAKVTGLDVSLVGLSGEWHGFTPTISVKSLSLSTQDDKQVVLSVNEAFVEVAILRSLLLLQPKVHQIFLDNAHVRLTQLPDRRWSFAGIEASRQQTGPIILPNWLMDGLLSLNHLLARNISTTLDFKNGQSELVDAIGISIKSDGDFRRISAAVGCSGCGQSSVVYESYGDPREKAYRGKAYVELNQLQAGNFSELTPSDYAPLYSRDVQGRFWFNVEPGYKISFSADLAVPDLGLGSLWQYPQRYLRDGYVKFYGEGALGQAEWSAYFQNITGMWEGQSLDYSGIGVSFDIDAMQLEFQMVELDAKAMAQQVVHGPATPNGLRDLLLELSPEGKLKQLAFTLPLLKADMREHITVTGILENVSTKPWKGVPGIEGISGYFQTSMSAGEIVVQDDSLSIDIPFIYDKPLQLQDASAQLAWTIDKRSLQIDSGRMSFMQDKASAEALISLDLPFDRANGDPEMSLLIAIENADISARDRFIPTTLPEDLLKWLEEGIKGGVVPYGAYLYRGSLLPDQKMGRTSQLYLDVRNAALDYHADWPAIKNANAQLHIDDANVFAIASKATLYDDVRASEAMVTVKPSAENGKPWLSVEAKATSSVPDALRLINESALRNTVGSTFARWEGRGRVSADLSLGIPLYANGQPQIGLDAAIQGEHIKLNDLGLELKDVSGTLQYGEAGIASNDLTGTLFGRTLSIDVAQQPSGQVDTRIKGSAAVKDLRAWIKQPFLDIAVGDTTFDVLIEAGVRNAVSVNSDLMGVQLNLPSGLFKSAAQPTRFEMHIPLGSGAQRWDIKLGDIGRFKMLMDGSTMQAGAMSVGASRPVPLMPVAGLHIGGQLENAELNEWLDLLKVIGGNGSSPNQKSSGSSALAMPIVVDSLFIRNAFALEQKFSSVDVSLSNGARGGQAWQINLASSDITGEIVVPLDDETPIRLMLSELHLPALPAKDSVGEKAGKSNAKPRQSKLKDIDPADLIDIDADVQALVIGDELWGDLGFSLRSDASGATFSNIRGTVRELQLDPGGENTSLYWYVDDQGHHSVINGHLLIANIGFGFERWGYERVIEGKNGELRFNLSWPDAPDLMTLHSLNGEMVVDAEEGRFPKSAEQAEGALKIVGVLNFGNLLRRLQFDFKDVFQKGVHFDDIDGELLFQNGMIHLKEPIDIDGPASRFLLSGDVNCNLETVDMELMATLPVGTNLPWIAGLVGGLPAAAGMYVASKLFEKQLDQVSSAAYTIKGDWAEPDVKFKKLFDVDPVKTAPIKKGVAVKRGGDE